MEVQTLHDAGSATSKGCDDYSFKSPGRQASLSGLIWRKTPPVIAERVEVAFILMRWDSQPTYPRRPQASREGRGHRFDTIMQCHDKMVMLKTFSVTRQ